MTEKKSPPEKTDKNAREIIAERKAEQQKPVEKKDPAKTNKANWSLRFLLILIIFLSGSAVAVYFLPVLKDRLPVVAKWVGAAPIPKADPLLAERLAALESRLNGQGNEIQNLKDVNNIPSETDPLLLERLNKLEQAETKQNDISQSGRIDMLLARMSQLETSFVPLSKGLSDAQDARQERSQLAKTTTTQAEQLSNMEMRLSKVEAFAARDSNGALIAFRIGELRRKVTSGAAYGAEIDALKAMMSQGSLALNDQITEAVNWLSDHKDGIATSSRLRDQFDNLIPELIRAKSSHGDDPWWTRAYNSTKNLIIVRKTENTVGNGLDDIIANAQRMMRQLDLKETLAVLKHLPDNMRDKIEGWILRAEIYLQAENELDRIESLTADYFLMHEEPKNTETPS